MESPNTLMITHVLRCMPKARHHSLVCSAGSQGYHALKEMLLSGVPGNTLLVESVDLRDLLGEPNDNDDITTCCLLYTFDPIAFGDPPLYCDHIPTLTTHVTLYSNMTTLPPRLLARLLAFISELKTVDLSPLLQVTAVQDSFLQGCSGLRNVDLSPLSQVTVIQSFFLSRCKGLTTIDLTPLSRVCEIGECFADECISLTSIDLAPLSNVTVIGGSFLQGCFGLTEIDLSPLSQLTVIEENFLRGCMGLTSIDLSPLSQRVTDIDEQLLNYCSGLKVIDLGSFIHLRERPFGLVSQCRRDGITLILPTHLEP